MVEAFLVFLAGGVVALALGGAFAEVMNRIQDRQKDCPLCWELIPAKADVCPKCGARL